MESLNIINEDIFADPNRRTIGVAACRHEQRWL